MPCQNPLASVILPVYNGQETVLLTIQSIIDQSFSNFELLVCDDASTDQSKDILSKVNEPRITIYHNKSNLGLGETLNKLISLTNKNSVYISTIEQDDIYKLYYLEDGINYLERNIDFGLVSGISEFWDGKKIARRFPGILINGGNYPRGKKLFLLNYREQLKVVQTCMIFRKDIHYKYNLTFTDKYPSLSVDWDYILRFSIISNIGGIHKTFVIQDRRPQRSSLTTKVKLKNQISRQLIRDFYLEFPHLINYNDYRYAIATQLYMELGKYKYIERLIRIIFYIIFIDPNKKRVINRILKEINKLFKWNNR